MWRARRLRQHAHGLWPQRALVRRLGGCGRRWSDRRRRGEKRRRFHRAGWRVVRERSARTRRRTAGIPCRYRQGG
jgi:hypothetical protein